ncbi:hypothetical protein COX73_01385 [bacterium (Candidatus Gribaldobacteria) CG_4_10_14_0_2_um_filter_36_18]|nr:MAG: hypothetical protein COX73_01385 [bacterium (Candidatus Gribaldobacteria) CG_4_10_14_0_2_um_filter_36_18]
MENLFGENYNHINNASQGDIELNLYCDEVKDKECPIIKDKWHYFGILIVPTNIEKIFLVDLLKKRFRVNNLSEVDRKTEYFPKNNRIVHFHSLGADTYHIAKRWYDYIRDPKSCDKVYFSILGVNQNKLNPESFGNEELFERIYNRFFRTAVIFSIKKYFPGRNIIIKNIFHEEGEQEYHEFFPWHIFYRINEDCENITCLNKEVSFLNKDHRKNNTANFIQLVDVILGSAVNNLHNSTKNEHKVKLTEDFSGLIKRLVESPENPNSTYCKDYYKRMNISFFPKQNINPKDEYLEYKKRMNQFYHGREIVFLNRRQKRLF